MSYYLSKYVGEYRLRAEIDQSTGDYCRDENGKLSELGVYIQCKNGVRIYHYGRDILDVYVPSIHRGNNFIKEIYVKYINPSNGTSTEKTFVRNDKEIKRVIYNYIDKEQYLKDIKDNPYILYIERTDEEVLFRIKDKYLNDFMDIFSPITVAVNRSPFSKKNLTKGKYDIPENDIISYKSIISSLDNLLEISHLTKGFISSQRNSKEIKAGMLKEGLDAKSYIHKIGLWDKYIKYLKENINK